jgi:hypothetical protein
MEANIALGWKYAGSQIRIDHDGDALEGGGGSEIRDGGDDCYGRPRGTE